MAKPKIGIIVGSTRPGRFADHPAKWINEIAGKREEFDVELLDLRDWPLPFFNEEISPALGTVEERGRAALAEEDRLRSTASSSSRRNIIAGRPPS